MNQILLPRLNNADLQRRAQVFTILERICQRLELTETQFGRARQTYQAVAKWLADSDDPLLVAIVVYLHGSGALGTTVRPLRKQEFDVDLIAFATYVSTKTSPAILKRAIGNRLAEHKSYATILEEKKRCWRLNYTGDFHLDISPTISNPNCNNGGELVPDRKLRGWHPTNPRAFKALFDRRAAMQPTLTRPRVATLRDEATIEPFPVHQPVKGILRRTVQLLKRHRDHHFQYVTEEVAPISVIITTLAMRSYQHCVQRFVFDDELEVLVETIRNMPYFIDRPVINGKPAYAIWNETTQGENFADRWNTEPARVLAFYQWQAKALADFEAVRDAIGIDRVAHRMQGALGESVVEQVIGARRQAISTARTNGSLRVSPVSGLSLTSLPGATHVPKNDFFGDGP